MKGTSTIALSAGWLAAFATMSEAASAQEPPDTVGSRQRRSRSRSAVPRLAR